jgi:ABC-2 type transport system ATP-binding protein
MLMGITRPDTGQIRVLDQSPGWRLNARIAYLPDRARWYRDHTVQTALHWGESFLPNFNRDRALELAEQMELQLNQPVDGMSRGIEVRLMVVLCLARTVPLFILDEPLSGVDLPSRERIIGALVDSASAQDATVLMSTHEIAEAESLFDYALFLRDGKVIKAGDTDDLRREFGSMQDILRQLDAKEGSF